MADQHGEQFPDPVTVPLAELRAVTRTLESRHEQLITTGDQRSAQQLDMALGRMARWIWELLSELDDEDGYDD